MSQDEATARFIHEDGIEAAVAISIKEGHLSVGFNGPRYLLIGMLAETLIKLVMADPTAMTVLANLDTRSMFRG